MELQSLNLNDQFFKFINEHLEDDSFKLRLKYAESKLDFDMDLAITQIECRRKFRKKLKNFLSSPFSVFPTVLAGEQATHEELARYHASLILPNLKVLDLSAGLGIDAMSLARVSQTVTACELESLKAYVLNYNSRVNGILNLNVINEDSIKWISEYEGEKFDMAFIDPTRRGNDGSRLYSLSDCSPDVLKYRDLILSRCNSLIIKASPMLDISKTIEDFPNASSIKVISLDGECKEVLVSIGFPADDLCLEAIDIKSKNGETSKFSFMKSEAGSDIQYADSSDICEKYYLYEPNASVMKLAPWKHLCRKYDSIFKLGVSSHLFISQRKYSDFPGRILSIESILDRKALRTIKGIKANVTTRNYPVSADDLRRKLKVSEGRDLFIYGTRLGNTPVLLLTRREN